MSNANPHVVALSAASDVLETIDGLRGGTMFGDADHVLGQISTRKAAQDTVLSAVALIDQAVHCHDLGNFLTDGDMDRIQTEYSKLDSVLSDRSHSRTGREAASGAIRGCVEALGAAVERMGPRDTYADFAELARWMSGAVEQFDEIVDMAGAAGRGEKYVWCMNTQQWSYRAECCVLHDALRKVMLPEGSVLYGNGGCFDADVALGGEFLKLSTGSIYSLSSPRLIAPAFSKIRGLGDKIHNYLLLWPTHGDDDLERFRDEQRESVVRSISGWIHYLEEPEEQVKWNGGWFMCTCDTSRPRR